MRYLMMIPDLGLSHYKAMGRERPDHHPGERTMTRNDINNYQKASVERTNPQNAWVTLAAAPRRSYLGNTADLHHRKAVGFVRC
jgi:hypothetical protein